MDVRSSQRGKGLARLSRGDWALLVAFFVGWTTILVQGFIL